MRNFSQTKFFKLVIVVAVFSLLVLWGPAGAFAPLRKAAMLLSTPFQKVFYFVSLRTMEVGEFAFSIGQLKTDNEELMRKNQELLAANARFVDIERENELLREQLEFLPREKFDLLAASVVSQDSHGLGNWIEIDKGTDDGLSDGMPVIVSKGILVGRLQEVHASRSKVILLTNPKSAINGVVPDTDTKGIARGEYGLGIVYNMVRQSDALHTGDDVITSGIGSNVPRGLYIGKVQEIHPSEDHLYQEASVASPVQIARLRFVFVLKNSKQ